MMVSRRSLVGSVLTAVSSLDAGEYAYAAEGEAWGDVAAVASLLSANVVDDIHVPESIMDCVLRLQEDARVH